MRTHRVTLLQRLEAVSCGVAKREVVEQSACFAFKNKICLSFNDEIACRIPVDLDFEGAVAAANFQALLSKLGGDEIDIEVAEGPEGNKRLQVKDGGETAWFAMEAEVLLPIDSVETPKTWQPLPEDYLEAVGIVKECAGTDATEFVRTCIHLHPEFMESCDNFQMARYPVATLVRKPVLCRAESLRHVTGLDMTEFAETRNWLHYRNPTGLVLSCRKFIEEYSDLTKVLEATEDGKECNLPKTLPDGIDKAAIFSSQNPGNNQVVCELRPGKMRLKGEGITGGYAKVFNISYDGPALTFLIAPKLLTEIVNKHNTCTIGPGRLRVDGGKWVFVSCLGKVD